MIALSLFTSLVKNAKNSPVSLIFWHNFDEYFMPFCLIFSFHLDKTFCPTNGAEIEKTIM